MKIVDFSRSEGQLGAQICFQEARKLREKELEGANSKLREKKSSKKRERESQGAPKKLESHDPLALSAFQSLQEEHDGSASGVVPGCSGTGRTPRNPQRIKDPWILGSKNKNPRRLDPEGRRIN